MGYINHDPQHTPEKSLYMGYDNNWERGNGYQTGPTTLGRISC